MYASVLVHTEAKYILRTNGQSTEKPEDQTMRHGNITNVIPKRIKFPRPPQAKQKSNVQKKRILNVRR